MCDYMGIMRLRATTCKGAIYPLGDLLDIPKFKQAA